MNRLLMQEISKCFVVLLIYLMTTILTKNEMFDTLQNIVYVQSSVNKRFRDHTQ